MADKTDALVQKKDSRVKAIQRSVQLIEEYLANSERSAKIKTEVSKVDKLLEEVQDIVKSLSSSKNESLVQSTMAWWQQFKRDIEKKLDHADECIEGKTKPGPQTDAVSSRTKSRQSKASSSKKSSRQLERVQAQKELEALKIKREAAKREEEARRKAAEEDTRLRLEQLEAEARLAELEIESEDNSTATVDEYRTGERTSDWVERVQKTVLVDQSEQLVDQSGQVVDDDDVVEVQMQNFAVGDDLPSQPVSETLSAGYPEPGALACGPVYSLYGQENGFAEESYFGAPPPGFCDSAANRCEPIPEERPEDSSYRDVPPRSAPPGIEKRGPSTSQPRAWVREAPFKHNFSVSQPPERQRCGPGERVPGPQIDSRRRQPDLSANLTREVMQPLRQPPPQPAPVLPRPEVYDRGPQPPPPRPQPSSDRYLEKCLPKYKMSTFSGDPLEWPEFQGMFESIVLRANISDDERMAHLKTLLEGKAKTAISGFTFDGSMFQEAWSTLKKKFGKPHLIVGAQIEKLTSYRPIKIHQSEQIIDYAVTINSLVNVLISLGYEGDLKSSSNLRTAASKLPPNMREKWFAEVNKLARTPDLRDFRDWLQDESDTHEQLLTMRDNSWSTQKNSLDKNKKTSSSFVTETKPGNCVVCSEDHKIWKCSDFLKKNPTERAEFAKDKKLCFACLDGQHAARNCQKARKCNQDGCNRKHNRLLHGADRVHQPDGTRNPVQNQSVSALSWTTKGILQVVKIDVLGPKATVSTLALCDSGSTHSWISRSLHQKLGLVGQMETFTVQGFNGAEELQSECATVSVTNKQLATPYSLEVLVKPMFSLGHGSVNMVQLREKYPHLRPVSASSFNLEEIQCVLGQTAFSIIRPLEYRCLTDKDPWAVRTPLGWVASGLLPEVVRGSVKKTGSFAAVVHEDEDLAQQVKSWWDMESFAPKSNLRSKTEEDRVALQQLEDTTTFDGERYTVRMLWAENEPDLPNNFSVARSNLAWLEKKFAKNDDLRRMYSETIASDLRLGYIREVPREETFRTREQAQWFLPHHPVVHPLKPGKVRRVVNASSKFKGKSLNDALVTGPDLLNNLIGVVMRFRKGRIAVCSDIEGMFMQIRVHEDDQPLLRFLWRDDPSEDVQTFEYTRHPFGKKDSPTIAIYAVNRTAADNKAQHQKSSVVAQRELYMDDFLRNEDDEDEAIDLCIDITELMKKGGFKLTKWFCNNERVLLALKDHGLTVLPFEDTPEIYVLGIKWIVTQDVLVVSRGTLKPVPEVVTQRTILATVSAVFDPLGVISPFSLRARLLLKRVWQTMGQTWDFPVHDELKLEYLDWMQQLAEVNQLQISRQYFVPKADSYQIHVFADASSVAFCAVVYLRAMFLDGPPQISFVLGKCRVAPMRQLTIPKLELQAALVAVNIADVVQSKLDMGQIPTFFWTDSSTALQWVRNSFKKQPVFVTNRVADILALSTVDQWHFIPGSINPADIGIRGMSVAELKNNRWLIGPAFLTTEDEQWPEDPFLPSTDEDVTTVISEVSPIQHFDWSRFSSFSKLQRCIAWMLRLTPTGKQFRSSNYLSVDELERAKVTIWKMSQRESFPAEMKALTKDKDYPEKSELGPYSPFLGADGLIRAQGRLSKSMQLDFSSKHPILLHSKHPAVKLFLISLHLDCFHQGTEYIRSVVQQNYWVVRLRSCLRQIKQNCLTCKRKKAQIMQPPMADLPSTRVNARMFPFADVGADFFGPFEIKQGRKSLKRWCFLLCCMQTRAVHIEICEALSTDACINALRRFIARRGRPWSIQTDNGTNFVRAANELRACVDNWNTFSTAATTKLGITWKFNPPSAPHFGGVWEKLVHLCKRAMYDIMGHRRVTDDVLATTMALVEQTLNARPLTAVSSDCEDLEALTPNHFIFGRPNICLPAYWTQPSDLYLRKAYEHAEVYADQVWKRWLKEYVPSLLARNKWYKAHNPDIQVGDLVWLVDSSQPRSTYPLARILQLFPGDDGIVRTVQLKTQYGTYTRPLVKCIPLNVQQTGVSGDLSPETGPAMLAAALA